MPFFCIHISQGSVATRLGCGGAFVYDCYKFPTESNGERILKIGQYLVKLWARVRCLVFLTHSVYLGKHWNAKMQKSRLSNAVIMVCRSPGTCCLISSILLTCISYAWCRHKSCTVIMRVRLWLLRHNCRRNELLQQNCAAW